MSAEAWRVHVGATHDLNLLRRRTLVSAWVTTWTAECSSPAISVDGRTWMSYAELEARSRAAAGRLKAAGAQPGDRVLLSAQSSPDLVVAHVAALRLGCVVVPVNTAYVEREVGHIVTDSSPAVAIVDDAARAGWIHSASGRRTRVVDPTIDVEAASKVAVDRASPDDPALIIYTSGTTGAPKGAVLSHANLLAGTEAVLAAWRWTASDRLILALPLFHLHGLGVGLHGTLLAGASAVLLPKFDATAVLDHARSGYASMYFGVPTMYSRLVAHADAKSLGNLRLLVSGSAPLPVELFDQVEARAGSRVLERYGMSETLMNISNPYDGERRAGSVGLPLPGVEVRLDARDEIQLRGPNVFDGYLNRPEATAEAFTDDGWFRSGDVGQVDDDGYYRIVGRTKELIISGGYNVYPREIEEALERHPAVAEAAVVGQPSDEWGEIVTAFVVAHDAVHAQALLDFAAEELASYKRPRVLHLVESLPRNALGKIVRADLLSR